jgi:thiamine-phosphate pyrophosphorylase
MLHQFTAAAQRALAHASGWTNHTGYDELEAEHLLVGLLSESECRAADMLKRCAIDTSTVCRRWPNLAHQPSPPNGCSERIIPSREVELSLQAAQQRLFMLPQPLELATEHILLGLATADHEVSAWLRQKGLTPDAIEEEIFRLYGYQKEPIPIEMAFPSESEDTAADFASDACKAASGCMDTTACDGDCCEKNTAASQSTDTLRILDAAANRAREGLRVVEDYLRFVLDDRHLTNLCKQLRHDLTDALNRIPIEHRLASRETQADVGTVLTTSGEHSRADATEVLRANFARLQESLRSLEEFGKLLDESLAAEFKQMRYRTYTLQRAADMTQHSIRRLAAARLYVLIDGRSSIEEFERLARSLIDAGADVIQLRDKQLDDRALLDRARRLRDWTQSVGPVDNQHVGQVDNLSYNRTLFIMNDRPDLAVLAHADGVHMGQEELSVKDARAIVGPEMLIGVSTHTIEQARQAVLDGASYIGVGPTFPSGTKSFEQYPGLELLQQVAAEIRLPAFAIGGIDRRNVDKVLATGLTRIAVGGAVIAANDPAVAVRELLSFLI